MILQIDAESKNEFRNLIKEEIKKAINENLPKVNSRRKDFEPDDQLLTREEVMKMLCVSHSTLYHYQRKKIIPFLKIGNRVYFKKRDILNNMNLEGDPTKYKTNDEKDEDDWD